MKKIIILSLALMAAFGVGAQQYALHYGSVNGPVVGANDTTVYVTTNSDMDILHMSSVLLYIENLTSSPLVTNNTIDMVEGPAGLVTSICAGGSCPQQGAYTLQPGDNEYMPLVIESHLLDSYIGQSVLYRVTVGNDGTMANAVTTYLRINIGAPQQYALHYGAVDGPVVGANDTTVYVTTSSDMDILHMSSVLLYIENLTSTPLVTNNTIEMVEGPAGLVTSICAGGSCPQQGAYTLQPGDNEYMPLVIESHLLDSYIGQSVLYRVKVGNDGTMANAVTTYLKIDIGTQGIDGVEVDGKKVAYPNPTTGKVMVGDKEYDLSDRPAGVYFLSTGKGTVRVIKL